MKTKLNILDKVRIVIIIILAILMGILGVILKYKTKNYNINFLTIDFFHYFLFIAAIFMGFPYFIAILVEEDMEKINKRALKMQLLLITIALFYTWIIYVDPLKYLI